MNSNEIFILCLSIAILIIFLSILFFAKGNGLFILAVSSIAIAFILITICLYLMNNMLNRLDDSSKGVGNDIGLLKESVKFIAKDNQGASQYIVEFLELLDIKNLPTEGIKIYKPEEHKIPDISDPENKEVELEIKKIIEENEEDIQEELLTPIPKASINLDNTQVSSIALTNAMQRLVERLRQQTATIEQTVEQVQQVQTTVVNAVTAVTEEVVNTIQNNTEVQQNIFNSPTVQQTIAQSTTIVNAVTQSDTIQQIIQNGGTVDLVPIQNAITVVNQTVATAVENINLMDGYLQFLDQSIKFVDENGNATSVYEGLTN
jgi:hypothetical protein